jgi:hypothetical protein
MRKRIPALAALALVVLVTAMVRAEAVKGEWTGWITDSHCGVNGANRDHTAACVEKCMKGGSQVQLYVEAEKKAYPINDFAKVKALVGHKVKVKGALSNGAITVESAEKAS